MVVRNMVDPYRKRYVVTKRFRYQSRVYEEGDRFDPVRVDPERWYLLKLWRQGHLCPEGEEPERPQVAEQSQVTQAESNDESPEQPRKKLFGRLADRLRGGKEGGPQEEE